MNRVRFLVLTLPALLGLGLATRSAQAGTELYLQFDPALHGSAKESAHPAWIVLDSYSLGVDAHAVGSGAGDKTGGLPDKGAAGGLPTKGAAGGLPMKGAGESLGEKGGAGDKSGKLTKVAFVTSDLTVLADLKAAVAKGAHFKTAILDVKKPTKGSASGEYLKITMTDVMISGLAMQSGASKERPAATITMTFVKESTEYSQSDAKGTRGATLPTPVTWDIASAKAE